MFFVAAFSSCVLLLVVVLVAYLCRSLLELDNNAHIVLYFLTFYSFSSSSSSDCSDSYRPLLELSTQSFFIPGFSRTIKSSARKLRPLFAGFAQWFFGDVGGGEGSCCCYDVCCYGGAVFFIFFLDQFMLILSSFSCAFGPRGFLNLWISEDGCRSSKVWRRLMYCATCKIQSRLGAWALRQRLACISRVFCSIGSLKSICLYTVSLRGFRLLLFVCSSGFRCRNLWRCTANCKSFQCFRAFIFIVKLAMWEQRLSDYWFKHYSCDERFLELFSSTSWERLSKSRVLQL